MNKSFIFVIIAAITMIFVSCGRKTKSTGEVIHISDQKKEIVTSNDDSIRIEGYNKYKEKVNSNLSKIIRSIKRIDLCLAFWRDVKKWW